MEIRFETDSRKGTWNILTPSILSNFKVKTEDVADVRLAYFALSNYPYEEENVAHCSHPCEGSVGFYIETKDAYRYLAEEIFFYDYNLQRSHQNGLPHWNHERRFDDGQQTWKQEAKYVDYHVVPDSPFLTLTITDKGEIIKEKTVKRVPMSEVRPSGPSIGSDRSSDP